MALTRRHIWADGEDLAYDDLNGEFNQFMNFINSYALLNPLTDDMNANGNYILNANFKKIWRVRSGDAYGIQAAVTDITSEASAEHQGGIVFLEAGEYSMTAPIVMAGNIWIVGSGWQTVLKKATAFQDDDGDELFAINAKNGCAILNLLIDGQGSANSATGGNGIAVVRIMGGSSDFHMDRVRAKNWGAAADGKSRQNDFVYIGQDKDGTSSGESKQIYIERCNLSSCARNGVSIVYASDVHVRDCTIVGALHAPIDAEPNVGQTVNKLWVEKNTCKSSEGQGIVCTIGTGVTADHSINDVTIRDNYVDSCTGYGIVLTGVRRFAVDGNRVVEPTSTGIWASIVEQGRIAGNSVISPAFKGIILGDNQGSSVYGVTGRLTADVDIMANYVSDATDHGIQLTSDSAGNTTGYMRDITIEGNRVVDCGNDTATKLGIILSGADSQVYTGIMRICGNSVKLVDDTTQLYGIQVGGTVQDLRISGNFTTGHVNAGLVASLLTVNGDLVMSDNSFKEGVEGI